MIKTSKQGIGRGQVLILVFVWLLLFAIPLLFGDNQNGINWNHIKKIWLEYLVVFGIFLLNRLFLIPYLFFKGQKILYFTSILIIILVFVMLVFMNSKNTRPGVPEPGRLAPYERFERRPGFPPPHVHEHKQAFIPPYGNLLILTILMVGFDTGLAISVRWIKAERNRIELEKEIVESKMAFLQTQVSPHFFMNTLNNIHALVDINTDEAKESIIKLSRMMNYMLYDSQGKSVELKREIEFIESYIELMKLRYTGDVDIVFDKPSDVPIVKVPPLLTISFIENAFKYGVSYEKPSFIHIIISWKDNRFYFNVRNSKHPERTKKKRTGIGIANSRKRLELIYEGNYELAINSESKDVFEVRLNIPL
jgi:hypothetical protein